jgi:predicted HNH restriction endonuclease
MVCGEDRVVDIHHKRHRNGEPPRASNSQRDDVWVLCPNHHAMIHRGVATPEDIGLV